MKSFLKLAGALFVSAFVTSCQKEFLNTLDPVVSPGIPPYDSVTRLSKLVYIDFRVSPTDTLAYQEYIYDNQQRVATISFYNYMSGTRSKSEVITYHYTGINDMAYKMEKIDPDPVSGYSETNYYLYDNAKRLIKDSISLVYGIPITEIDSYAYTGTTIIVKQQFIDPSNPLDTVTSTATGFIGTTGDVIKTNTVTASNEYYTNTFAYDDKPNPFYQLNIRNTYNPVPGFDFFLEDFYLQKNNVISGTEKNQSLPGLVNNSNYTYTYNALGLPTSVDITYSFSQTDDYRIIFVYKKI